MENNCLHCKALLTEENSSTAQRSKGRGRALCTLCCREYAKSRRAAKPLTHIVYRAKGNAKIRGIEFNITEKDLPPIPTHCPVFPWIELVYKVGVGRCDGSLSLDRVDSSKGYVSGNLRFISDKANRMKSDMSDKELIALGRDADKRLFKQ